MVQGLKHNWPFTQRETLNREKRPKKREKMRLFESHLKTFKVCNNILISDSFLFQRQVWHKNSGIYFDTPINKRRQTIRCRPRQIDVNIVYSPWAYLYNFDKNNLGVLWTIWIHFLHNNDTIASANTRLWVAEENVKTMYQIPWFQLFVMRVLALSLTSWPSAPCCWCWSLSQCPSSTLSRLSRWKR